MRRTFVLLLSLGAMAAAGGLGAAFLKDDPPADWEQLSPGVFRTKAAPHGYALVGKGEALLIDATVPPAAVKQLKADAVKAVLLTHHHRDTAAFAAAFAKTSPVRAAKEAAEWLTPAGVTKFWAESIPLRNSRTAYFVLAEGVEKADCTLADGEKIAFGPWSVTCVATPGHSRDHLAFHVRNGDDVAGPEFLFCGDAFHSAGKMWAPFTTDWDHWTDAGLKPAAESLRKLAKLATDRTAVCPAHGPVLRKDGAKALEATAAAVDEAGFQKSFERFSKRVGEQPKYDFLVPKNQVASNGSQPWSKVSDHVWITGNTYVVKSKTSPACLVLDPWGERIVGQIDKLLAAEKLGPVEVTAFSHAHYDHFDGLYYVGWRDRVEVWGLDVVAAPLKDPLRFRAPFLDARPIRFTKELKDGETAAWGGYTFKFFHLPGQSYYTCGIGATIDGKRCVFTADNFFHQDQFSGSGGWMGLNRSSPVPYGASAKKVLEMAPEWILAEHGGPYVFHPEDYRRRAAWGEAAGRAADAVCVSGRHLRDWTPHRVSAEPVLRTAKPGDAVTFTLHADGTGAGPEAVTATVRGRGRFPDQAVTFDVRPGERKSQPVTFRLPADLPPGRHIFNVTVTDASGADPVDPFVAVDVP